VSSSAIHRAGSPRSGLARLVPFSHGSSFTEDNSDLSRRQVLQGRESRGMEDRVSDVCIESDQLIGYVTHWSSAMRCDSSQGKLRSHVLSKDQLK
jgi:hypothetical protein